MKDYVTKRGNYSIAFNSERSIEDELERESHGEIGTVLFSYGIMFLYIALSLGEVTQIRRFFVDSKISLGIVGVGVVLGSVGCSVGVFGWVGVPATLIIIEVGFINMYANFTANIWCGKLAEKIVKILLKLALK